MAARIEQRHRDAKDSVYRLTDQRDACIAKLVRADARLIAARRTLARIERAKAKAKAAKATKPQTPLTEAGTVAHIIDAG